MKASKKSSRNHHVAVKKRQTSQKYPVCASGGSAFRHEDRLIMAVHDAGPLNLTLGGNGPGPAPK
jgi:hypothetical protein